MIKTKYNASLIRNQNNTKSNLEATESIKQRQKDFEKKLEAKLLKNLKSLNNTSNEK